MFKPANHYQTRFGRRAALVAHAIPFIVCILAVSAWGAVYGVYYGLTTGAAVAKQVWNR